MELTTRSASWGIEIKTDEITTDIYKNGNESDEFIKNLLQVIEDVCGMRDEHIYDYLQRHYNVEIKSATEL